jgi:hypothetical protein
VAKRFLERLRRKRAPKDGDNDREHNDGKQDNDERESQIAQRADNREDHNAATSVTQGGRIWRQSRIHVWDTRRTEREGGGNARTTTIYHTKT